MGTGGEKLSGGGVGEARDGGSGRGIVQGYSFKRGPRGMKCRANKGPRHADEMRQIQELWRKGLAVCLVKCGITRRSGYHNEKTRPSHMQFAASSDGSGMVVAGSTGHAGLTWGLLAVYRAGLPTLLTSVQISW